MGSRLSRQSSLEEESGEEPCPGRLESGRGDFHLSSLLLHPQKLPGVLRKASPAPYVRRVGWLREIQATIREHKREHAVHILRLLRKVPAAGCGPGRAGQDGDKGPWGAGAAAPARRSGAGAAVQEPPPRRWALQPSLVGLFVLLFTAPCPDPFPVRSPPCQATPATSPTLSLGERRLARLPGAGRGAGRELRWGLCCTQEKGAPSLGCAHPHPSMPARGCAQD